VLRPPRECGLPGDRAPLLGRHFLHPRAAGGEAPATAELDGVRILSARHQSFGNFRIVSMPIQAAAPEMAKQIAPMMMTKPVAITCLPSR
jgi:glycine cleavage system protein P-like pyridoxal-binding family